MHQTHSSDVIISSTLFVSSISKPCIVAAMFMRWDRHLAKHRLLMYEHRSSSIVWGMVGGALVEESNV
jgi:hypothetical protein